MPYQFVHLETYARACSVRKDSRTGESRRSGGGRTVGGILAEARRDPDASMHVETPRPPVVVHGIGIDQLERLHDERAAAAKLTTRAGKLRRAPTNQSTMLAIVISHPATELTVDVMRWQRKTVAWLRERYGDQLVSVAAIAAAPDLDPKAANRIGDAAYRAAMRLFQDQFARDVAMECGLARLGPGRRRLTRDAWHAEQAVFAAVGQAVVLGEKAEARLEKAQSRRAGIVAATKAHVRAARAAIIEAKRIAEAAAERSKTEADELLGAAQMDRDTAAAELRAARRQAQDMVAEAEIRVGTLRRVGARIGGVWSGLRGVEDKLNAVADARVETVRAEAKAQVEHARSSVRTELQAQFTRRLKETEARAVQAEARLVTVEQSHQDQEQQLADASRELVELRRFRRLPQA